MPASRIAALTAAATFSTIAGRPISSGKSSALIAVPIARRDVDGEPLLPLLAKTVACGVMTPSQPPDQTIGMAAISASLRLPYFCSARRKAWSARMRVKSFTPPLPSVFPMTAITSSAPNCPRAMHASSPEASCTVLSSTFATSIANSPSSRAARNDALRQREAIFCDVAGARVPDPILVLVLDAMLDGLAHRTQAERLPDDEAVQRQRIDERLVLRLLQHLLELIHDHLAEFAAGVIAMRLRAGVVQFHRIGDRQQRSGARLHPDRLVVERPIEQMGVAGLFEQVCRDVGFERAGAHPSGGTHADMLFDHLGAFLDGARLVVLPHSPQQLGIGAAVAEHIVAAGFDLLHDLLIGRVHV